MRHLATSLVICLTLACSPAPEPEENVFDPAAYLGRWLVVNYWAEWCKPCREEIPELNRLAGEHGDRVAVLGVNYDGLQGEALEQAVTAMEIEFPATGDDPSLALKQPRPAVLPTTLVFDAEGNFQRVLVGPQSYEDLLELLNQGGAP